LAAIANTGYCGDMSGKFGLLLLLLLSMPLACGPAAVELRPSNSCDGGNLELCAERCDANEARACYRLGWFHEQDRDVKGSVKRAVDNYDRACNANFAVACRALGILYWRGKRVDRSRSKALSYFDRACKLGLPEACPTKDMLRKAAGKKKGGGGAEADGDGGFSLSVSAGESEPAKTSE